MGSKRILWVKNRFTFGLILLLALQVILPFLQPQAAHAAPLVPEVLKDINAVSGSGVSDFTRLGDTTIFVANDDTHGQEIWKTDGTTSGTVLVKDIVPGATNSQPRSLLAMDGYVYFFADTASGNRELYRTDGTSSGTTVLTDFSSPGGYGGDMVGVFNNELYFSANDNTSGLELWKTDGIVYEQVKDINPGSDGSVPYYGTVINNALYFYAIGATINETGLYKTDGTTGGTVLVKGDLTIGNLQNIPTHGFYIIGNTMFFKAFSSGYGQELWKSDGTTAGTIMVKDIYSGGNSSSPDGAAVAGNNLYFKANDGVHGQELWKSDGTEAGTTIVKDINSGSNGSNPQNITGIYDKVYFSSNNGSAQGVYVSNGTEAGTMHLSSGSDPVRGGGNFIAYGDKVFFGGNNTANGTEIWQTNGTAAGTSIVADTIAGSGDLNPYNFIVVGQTMYFAGTIPDSYDELYKMDLPTINTTDQNDDGVPDGLQPNIASLTAAGKTVVIDAGNNCQITSPSAVDESSLSNQDDDYTYPSGLLNFGGSCNQNGFTTTVTLYFYDIHKANLTLRKYNPNNKTYAALTAASLSEATVNGHTVTIATYDITDGDTLDMDSAVNGSFVDPVGLAASIADGSTESLAATGSNVLYIVVAATGLLLLGGAVLKRQLK